MSSRTSRSKQSNGTAPEFEQAILGLLEERGPSKTICPSEVARSIANSTARPAWEPLMQPVREAALRLARAGRIVIMQRGKVIDGDTVKGPIRFARR